MIATNRGFIAMNFSFARNAIIAIALMAGTLFSQSASADSVTYYHNDLLGSPIVATKTVNGVVTVIWREGYAPYGERQLLQTGSVKENIWFTSRHEDANTELLYMGARYYDPLTARFLSTDPRGFSGRDIVTFNKYSYANNNPLRFVDLNGAWSTWVHHKIIETAFGGRLNSFAIARIKAGSDRVDSIPQQIVGNSYEHAMRDEGQTAEEAEKLMWKFVEHKLKMSRFFLMRGDAAYGYELLGEAMHPIMDSTSPNHEGFQKWHLYYFLEHGNFGASAEDTINRGQLERTVQRMRDVIAGKRTFSDEKDSAK
jgi:RHS repeat-associated protein